MTDDKITVTDTTGRVLEIAVLTTREKMRLARQMGAAADIDRWWGQVVLAAHVRSIDGVPVPMPGTPDMADAMTEKVGPPGADEVAKWYMARGEAEAEKTEEAAKNSQGTPTS